MEDQESVRMSIGQMLNQIEYEVEFAEEVTEATALSEG